MKKIFLKTTLLLFFSALFLTCSEKKSNIADIKSFVITIDSKDYTVTFDTVTKKSTIILPAGSVIPLEVTIKDIALSTGASSSLKKGSQIIVIDGIATITITAEDGTKATFSIEFMTEYIVSFNSSGDSAFAVQNIIPGGKAVKPKDPKRKGNTFVGWYKDKIFTNAFDFDNDVITDNISLYALWQVTISFNSNGGNAVEAQTIVSGSKIIKPENPKRKGNTFVGWYKDKALTTAFNTKKVVNANTTLYAKWHVIVSFNSNGGNAVEAQTIVSGSKAIKPTIPKKNAYIFAGWYKDVALTTAFDFNKDIITANTTLYAKWNVSVTVMFNSNEGTNVNIQNISSGSKAAKPEDPKKAGYTFLDWYKEESLTTPFDFDNDVVTENTTLHAKWEFSIVATSYSGDAYLGVAMRDAILADADTVLSITEAIASLEYTWKFGGQTGVKKANSDGTFFIIKKDIDIATLTDGAIFSISLYDESKDIATYKPYEIRHWKDLQAMRVNLTDTYALMKDISFPPLGTEGFDTVGFEPIGKNAANRFTGKFTGNLHTISGLTINRRSTDYVGLFGYVKNATIERVIIDHAGIQGSGYVGALVGKADNSTIQNVGMKSTNGLTVSGVDQYVGGLVGSAENSSTIIGFATGNVSNSDNSTGGLVGYATSSSTIKGYATGKVNGNQNVGGLVGNVNKSIVIGYATGDVSGNGNNSNSIGGLFGRVDMINTRGNINNWVIGYAIGSVSGIVNVGGLVGLVKSGPTIGYARGNVSAITGATQNTFGLLAGDGFARGYVSDSVATESQFAQLGIGNVSLRNSGDGTPVTISSATQQTFLNISDDFIFDDVGGFWHYVADGKWPAINLDFDKDFSKIADGDEPSEQPL